MSGKRSPETEVAVSVLPEQLKSFYKYMADKKPVPFGFEERKPPKNPYVVNIPRGRNY